MHVLFLSHFFVFVLVSHATDRDTYRAQNDSTSTWIKWKKKKKKKIRNEVTSEDIDTLIYRQTIERNALIYGKFPL